MRDEEKAQVCAALREALALRDKYRVEPEIDYSQVVANEDRVNDPFAPQPHNGGLYSFEMRRGIMVVWPESDPKRVGLRPAGASDIVRVIPGD